MPNRIDDEYFENKDKKQIAEITCQDEQARVLIPVKHPAQKAHQPEKKSA